MNPSIGLMSAFAAARAGNHKMWSRRVPTSRSFGRLMNQTWSSVALGETNHGHLMLFYYPQVVFTLNVMPEKLLAAWWKGGDPKAVAVARQVYPLGWLSLIRHCFSAVFDVTSLNFFNSNPLKIIEYVLVSLRFYVYFYICSYSAHT